MGFWNWFKKKQEEAEGYDHEKAMQEIYGKAYKPSLETKVSEAIAQEVSEKKNPEGSEEEEEPIGPFGRMEAGDFDDIGRFDTGIKGGLDGGLDEAFAKQEAAAKRDLTHPFKIKALLTNKTLTVYLPSGDIVSNTDADRTLYFLVIAASTEEEVKSLMIPTESKMDASFDKSLKETKEKQEKEEAVKGIKKRAKEIKFSKELSSIEETGEFYMKEGALYMKGIDLSVPKELAEQLLLSGNTGDERLYESLKNFWRWCSLNPDPVTRRDIFTFLRTGDFKITSGGMFLAYRRVAKVTGDKKKDAKLTAFISASYIKVKGQKKSPKNFEVAIEGDDYKIVKMNSGEKVVGNLAELYTNLSSLEENVFTDAHTHTMRIQIGTEVSMDRNKCDKDPSSDCSRGLHAMSKGYGHNIGDTLILVAINPMNVVAVPRYNENKLRCCAYMPLAIIKDWVLEDSDFDTLELQEEYFGDQVGELEAMVQASKPTETIKNQLVTLIKREALDTIATQLLDAGAILSKRVVAIK